MNKFNSVLASNVFGQMGGFWQTLLALTIHLTPIFLLQIVLWGSWRLEWIGGTLLPLLGIFYAVWAWNKPFGHWSVLLLMAGPLLLAGVLFLVVWHHRYDRREKV